MTRNETIVDRLRRGLDAQHVELIDDSDKHAGHAGARGGAGHYRVVVVAERFTGLDRIARHRAIHEALGDLFPNEIHALSAQAYDPAEWSGRAR